MIYFMEIELMKRKTLKKFSTIGLCMLSTMGASAQVLTGDAELDFPEGSPNTLVVPDPGGLDVSLPPFDPSDPTSPPAGTISGWDALDVRFRYDPDEDLMYVAVNTVTPGGDADGDGDPSNSAPWIVLRGGTDVPDYGGSEAVLVVFDIDQDGVGDVIIGTPPNRSIDDYVVANYNSALPLFAATLGFSTPLPGNAGEVLNTPQAEVPGASIQANDLIMTISNWSTLPFSGTEDDSIRAFSFVMFQGSTVDLGVGEEWTPGIGEFDPVDIPEESPLLGSIGNLVWKDTNENGFFEEDSEEGIPGVVVVLCDSDGNEIGQQITDDEGAYLFSNLPEGDYTVKVASSNFDDCGTPLYKSGKWALGDGLQFDGENVTYQPGVAPVDGAFSIAALVKPTLGELMTVVEKGIDPWPYALWINPTGEIQFGIDSGSGLEFVTSTGTLAGSLEHIAVTFDGSNVRFYINGTLDSTVPFAVTVSDTVGDLFVGRDFVGTINDLRIYNTDLSDEAISHLAFMECGALADFYQTTVIGGTDDNTNKPTTFTYSLAEGEDYPGADFGFNELGSIGNTVWCEDDGDGFFEPQDGEKGIFGVQVLLKDASGDVIATTTTDENGQYIFDGLAAGSYTVEVPLTGSNAECQPTLASIDQAALNRGYEILEGLAQNDHFYSDRTYTVHAISDTLAEAQFVRTANDDRNSTAQDLLTLTLTGASEVYLAFYGNGHKPAWLANEGWTLTNETFQITNGSCIWTYEIYSKSLPAGEVALDGPGECAPMYGVFVQDAICGVLADKVITTLRDGDVGDGANRTSPHSVDLGPGQDYIQADFGFKVVNPSACIGNLVFCDNNGNGIFEPNNGETGIKGVRVLLKDSSGNVIAVQRTDSSGGYLFEDLAPGCYTVKVSNRNFKCGKPLYRKTQVVDRSDSDEDNVNRCQPLEICLEAGDCYVKADFGYLGWCNYHYHCNYWRYNYRVRCWERRNNCYTNCWRFAD